MAVVSPAPAMTQRRLSTTAPSYRELRVRVMTPAAAETASGESSVGAIMPMTRIIEEKIYVAVGKSLKACRSIMIWALQNSGGKRICILHVHQPSQTIPFLGAKFPASSLKEKEVEAFRELERLEMHKMLDQYLLLCRQIGVRAEKLYAENDSIEKGIIELISQHGIRKLVMGAAADKRFSKNMTGLKSKKAIFVCKQAPASCHIHFICKGHLMQTREGSLDTPHPEDGSSQQASHNALTQHTLPDAGTESSLHQSNDLILRHHDVGRSSFTSLDSIGVITPRSRSDAEESSDESDELSRSTSQGSVLSTCSSGGMVNLGLIPLGTTEDGQGDDRLYDQLEQAMANAVNSKREAYEEAIRRSKAEKDALEAIRRVKALESLYAEESRQRKQIEEEVVNETAELERWKHNKEKVTEELRVSIEQKSSLETQISESDQMVKELEQKIISAVDLLQKYKRERDQLQLNRDNTLKEAEELRKSRSKESNTQLPQFFSEFSFAELEEATHKFDPSFKIGEGGYGSIYRGILRHSLVAVKMLHSHSMQGPSEFLQEVDVLSKMRHPNVITLIGACPEAWALIYEYLPNGSLEDRLSCRDNSPPLSWQTRLRVATELCSALIFLHSSKPHSIIHGDLKPSNILLDANFVSKLSDFGICRLLSHEEGSNDNATVCCVTDPKGTFVYMDPEFLASGQLTSKSDVYSFGIILLRLLTGRPALGITREVKYALDKGNLKNLLDPLAGDWPFIQAEQLAHLALRCCEMNRKSRPDLASDVWRVLEPMKVSFGGSSRFRYGSENQRQPPPYFICPIFQEIMLDPHVAADGFTYEAEAVRGWLDSGHDTSPMTNLKLSDFNLVPNHAFRSAIQEWLQQQQV